MYSWEIDQFIKDRNYYIGGDDLIKVTSTVENPQLIHILYNAFGNRYYMKDNENNNFSFTPMPYEEAKEKGLVKKLIKG